MDMNRDKLAGIAVGLVTAFGKYTWPRIFQVLPEYPVPFRVMPFSSAAMILILLPVRPTLPAALRLSSRHHRGFLQKLEV
jgi:hypothetical protein